MLIWAAGRGQGTGREQQLMASLKFPNPERLGSMGKVKFLCELAALS